MALTLVAVHAYRGHWIGDFWEHSAVVRELATHPTSPRHPLLLVDAPHAFANPYALLVAVLCRLTGASSVTGLAVASIANLLMLFVALRAFVRQFAAEHEEAVGFYLLLFTLLLWGPEPWDFSGFFHINVLSHALAYPSACAFWVSLLLLVLNQKGITERRPRLLVASIPMTAFVLLVHPAAFLFLATGVVAIAIDGWQRRTEALVSVTCLGIGALVALTWPYFPLWELLTHSAAAFNANNEAMYSRPLLRTWPALLGVPLLRVEARRSGGRVMALWFTMLLGIYLLGFVAARYNYGRVLVFLVFLLHFQLAGFVARIERKVATRQAGLPRVLVFGTVAIACILLSAPSLTATARDTLFAGRTSAGYAILGREVGQYDVMMADLGTGWIAASFGGKLVSAQHPLAFVSEREQRARRTDVRTFFDAATGQRERIALLRKHRVSYLLAPRGVEPDSAVVSAGTLRALGETVHEDDRLLLVRVDRHGWQASAP